MVTQYLELVRAIHAVKSYPSPLGAGTGAVERARTEASADEAPGKPVTVDKPAAEAYLSKLPTKYTLGRSPSYNSLDFKDPDSAAEVETASTLKSAADDKETTCRRSCRKRSAKVLA